MFSLRVWKKRLHMKKPTRMRVQTTMIYWRQSVMDLPMKAMQWINHENNGIIRRYVIWTTFSLSVPQYIFIHWVPDCGVIYVRTCILIPPAYLILDTNGNRLMNIVF